jgi:hypothetical protein
MSHAQGQCRFEDGEIWWWEYDGTSDIVLRPLFKTSDELSENWRKGLNRGCTCGGHEIVELAHDYGGGSYWHGSACRKCGAITSEWEMDEINYTDGHPNWWLGED